MKHELFVFAVNLPSMFLIAIGIGRLFENVILGLGLIICAFILQQVVMRALDAVDWWVD